MMALTDRDKRTIRLAAIGLMVYLVLFFSFRAMKAGKSDRVTTAQLQEEVRRLQREIQEAENRQLLGRKLKETYKIDFAKLSRTTLVAEASAAIQAAAKSGNLQIGPIRETAARASAKELSSMQVEAMGPVPGILGFLHKLETLGFPLIIDSVQLQQEATKPGMLKLNLSILILDVEQWKKEGKSNV